MEVLFRILMPTKRLSVAFPSPLQKAVADGKNEADIRASSFVQDDVNLSEATANSTDSLSTSQIFPAKSKDSTLHT